MQYGHSYRHASQDFENVNHHRSDSNDEATTAMLSRAAPTSQYEAYRPPIQYETVPGRNRLSMSISPLSAHTSTVPAFLPISSASSAFLSPSEPQQSQSSPPSPGFRARLFGGRDGSNMPYQENVAWANSTQFRTAASKGTEQNYEIQTVEALDADRPSKQYFRSARHFHEPWRPGVWVPLPGKGLGALGLVVLWTTGSAIIIVFSNGTRPDEWKIGNDPVQPQVYISVFEMIMNLLMFYALAEGIVIAWWRRLLHGTSLADVYDIHESSYLWSAVRRMARLQFNSVSIATLLTILSCIRGPLFQRSMIISNGIYRTNTVHVVLGVIISIAGVLAILPLYYGFWELGRKVSLNPLEIARAFGAPLFDGLDGNMTASGIEIERGATSVRYGALERLGCEKVLRIGDSSRANVRTPWQGEIFG
ncbi:hypothetical protein BKA66DRAFT_67582 [Pyrenochaeta sp. MPI-SDFR-AT-0127]|nr:hypothetical protein BKA66DRAFT_67582 [Pyrenochaeta sp. MPI-SDFR-AT-0127]